LLRSPVPTRYHPRPGLSELASRLRPALYLGRLVRLLHHDDKAQQDGGFNNVDIHDDGIMAILHFRGPNFTLHGISCGILHGPKIDVFPGLMLEHFYVTFGDGLLKYCAKKTDKQTNRQTYK